MSIQKKKPPAARRWKDADGRPDITGRMIHWGRPGKTGLYRRPACLCGFLELTGDYRTEFYLGEDLDLTGMKAVAVISDGTRQELSLTDLTIEGYNKDKRGEQKLKISYKEAFVELTVRVLKKMPVRLQ